jgi:hypothetical protein
MTNSRLAKRPALRDAALAATAFHAAVWSALAGTALAMPSFAPPAAAQAAGGFTPVGSFGAYRLDGVRHAVHEGAQVRLIDMTLHNLSPTTTFPDTIQAVWWQGRNSGEQVKARRRDLSPFGMYDYVKPGQVVEVTYVIPVRDDIHGIRVDYMHGAAGQKERRWTWDELLAGAPGVLYSKGRPVGTKRAAAPVAAPGAQAERAWVRPGEAQAARRKAAEGRPFCAQGHPQGQAQGQAGRQGQAAAFLITSQQETIS